MKKLFPLLLFGVAILLFSCEKNEPTIAKVEFTQALQTLTYEDDLTIKVEMTRPALEDIKIPFELTGDAVEGEDFRFTNVEDHYIRIPQGRLDAVLTLEHLLHNGIEMPLRITLKPGNGYQLGGNNVCVVTIGKRETIYLTFDQVEYPTEEFSNVYIGVTLTGEKSGANFKAPENITLGYKVISNTDANAPNATNVTTDGWSWISQNNDNNTITIEKGTNKAGRMLRVKYATTTLPDPIVEPEPGEEPVEATVYRAAVTIRTIAAMTNYGIEYGEVDTTHVIYQRLQNPIEDLLMDKKWSNPTLAFNEYFSNRELFWSNMVTTAGSREAANEEYELLPYRNQRSDNFVFTKVDDGVYEVEINAAEDSEFANYFISDTVSFKNYRSINTPYLEGAGTGGFSLNMTTNKAFSPYPAEEEIVEDTEVVFIPGSVSGEDNSYMDIIILSNNYTRLEGRLFYTMATWKSISGTTMAARQYDVWYRVYADQTNP